MKKIALVIISALLLAACSSTSKENNVSMNISAGPAPTVTSLTGSPSTGVPGGCIITLFGKKYDVATLRGTHPGGDIFRCGTDMTGVFVGQHGNDMGRMSPYLVK